jgi:hypothetical protein
MWSPHTAFQASRSSIKPQKQHQYVESGYSCWTKCSEVQHYWSSNFDGSDGHLPGPGIHSNEPGRGAATIYRGVRALPSVNNQVNKHDEPLTKAGM